MLTTFNAIALVDRMVLLDPRTLIVPPPVALKPMPDEVIISRPLGLLLKLMVEPVLLVKVTAVLVPVVSDTCEPLKLIVPPLEFWMRMPCALAPLLVMAPVWKVTVPASWLSISTAKSSLSLMLPL